MRLRLATAAVTAVASGAGAYAALRPWFVRWGATGEETLIPLPGDPVVPVPRYEATHAITVDAPIGDVWPWVAQLGQDRGGFYSYDRLENLVGCRIHNADEVVAEWQERRVGDRFPLHPDWVMEVVEVDPPTTLVVKAPDDSAVWAFVLHQHKDDGTRVLVRFRSRDRVPGLRLVHFVMERRMLLGLKERAERSTRPKPALRVVA